MNQIVEVELDRLRAHRCNSNVMPSDLFEKLVAHIGRSDRYPPVIVRRVTPTDGNPCASGVYEILDGHHRVAALRKLGRTSARCVVWEVDEDEALLLLATLNRLQGQDDPRKRGALLDTLMHRRGEEVAALAAKLPESAQRLRKLLTMTPRPGPPRPPRALHDMPAAVHFFLLPDQRRELETALRAIGGEREAALMEMVRRAVA